MVIASDKVAVPPPSGDLVARCMERFTSAVVTREHATKAAAAASAASIADAAAEHTLAVIRGIYIDE